MKTTSNTFIDPKGLISVTTTYQLTTAEKAALKTIASCACHWEKKRPYVEFRSCSDKLDESKTLTQPPCHALCEAGLLSSDPMACHGYQFHITDLGREVAAKLKA